MVSSDLPNNLPAVLQLRVGFKGLLLLSSGMGMYFT